MGCQDGHRGVRNFLVRSRSCCSMIEDVPSMHKPLAQLESFWSKPLLFLLQSLLRYSIGRAAENGHEPIHLYTRPTPCSVLYSSCPLISSHFCHWSQYLGGFDFWLLQQVCPLLSPSPAPLKKQPFVTEYRLVLWSFPSFLVHPASPPNYESTFWERRTRSEVFNSSRKFSSRPRL